MSCNLPCLIQLHAHIIRVHCNSQNKRKIVVFNFDPLHWKFAAYDFKPYPNLYNHSHWHGIHLCILVSISLQRSLSKEDEIKKKYEKELQKCHQEKLVLTTQLERALQERNMVVKDTNLVIQERNALALQAQQEYERAERYVGQLVLRFPVCQSCHSDCRGLPAAKEWSNVFLCGKRYAFMM